MISVALKVRSGRLGSSSPTIDNRRQYARTPQLVAFAAVLFTAGEAADAADAKIDIDLVASFSGFENERSASGQG